ncbi:MAG: HipA domain-containing protein, partial [Oscillospiraceae bacterium]|nr:HipA domain-containing protein [Oscillospiraceae bacterium]
WTERSIPASRSGVREALETLEISNTRMLLLRCLGLSLSDQYWIRPEGAELQWEKINFFNNPFSEDIGDVLFGGDKKANALDFSSPDSTSDGNLKKRWKIIDGKRCLIKGGSNPFRQQPFNEVIATGIMERLGIPHVPYTLTWNQEMPYSVCEDFITGDTELIPAWRIIQTQKKQNDLSTYQHFVNCAEGLGIPDVVPFLNRMIVLDYIIANEDRHLNNFGAIRNAETLEWICMAPIYDSGSSLGYDKLAFEIRRARNVNCKPFKNHHEEQLKLVTDFSWINFDQLADIRDLIVETLSAEGTEEFVVKERIEIIAESVLTRIEHVRELSMAQTVAETDSLEDDVKENIAEDYSHKMTL